MKKYILSLLPLAVAGCLKAPSTQVQKGTEASCQQIDQYIQQARTQSVLTIKKDEYANIDTSYAIEKLPPQTIGQYAVTVLDRQENAQEIVLRIREDNRELVNGQFKNSSKEDSYTILKPGNSATSSTGENMIADVVNSAVLFTVNDSQTSSISTRFKIRSGVSAKSNGPLCQQKAEGKVASYNNLEVQDIAVAIPSSVKMKPNCGGLSDCNAPLHGKLLKFDRWLYQDNGEELKVTSYLITSPDVPYFAGVFSQCLQYSQPYNDAGQKIQVLITECDNVTDFTFGN